MALWDEKFESKEEKLCATRMLEAWDNENICSTCFQQMAKDHRCDKADAAIYDHSGYVIQAIKRSTLLNSIRRAHENPTPITMGVNFFTAAEGQYSSSSEETNSSSPRRYSDSSSSDEEQHSGTEDSDDSGRSDTESAHGSYRSERDESDASDHDSDL
jgi:hypothetical protein